MLMGELSRERRLPGKIRDPHFLKFSHHFEKTGVKKLSDEFAFYGNNRLYLMCKQN
jgi:hypothetical protein